MNWEIQRINHILPGADRYDPDAKTELIVQWIQSVIWNIDHYKAEHRALVKEATALLELALWKAKLAGFRVEGDKCSAGGSTETQAKIDVEEVKKEARIISGADIIIKNVLPYLKMK